MIYFVLTLKTNVKPRPLVLVFLYGKITKKGEIIMKKTILSIIVVSSLSILLTGYETQWSVENKNQFNQNEVQKVLTNSVAASESQMILWNHTR
jgi:hypothetical protein